MKYLICIVLCLLPGYSWSAFYRCDINGDIKYQQIPCLDTATSSKQVVVHDMELGYFDTKRKLASSPKKTKAKKSSTRKFAKSKMAKRQKCWTKKRKLEDVQNRLRSGYSATSGKKLKRRRRYYEDYLREFCSS